MYYISISAQIARRSLMTRAKEQHKLTSGQTAMTTSVRRHLPDQSWAGGEWLYYVCAGGGCASKLNNSYEPY